MKAFIDTSSLIKKYIAEKGSDEFDTTLKKISEIIVSPVYILEFHSAIQRRLKEKTLAAHQAAWLLTEAKRDFHYYSQILWGEDLQQKAIEIIQKHHLKTLDSLQLASACLSQADIFITSDQKLFQTARQELKNVKLIA